MYDVMQASTPSLQYIMSSTCILTLIMLLNAGSDLYGTVGGGCMLSSLINFSTRQENFALKTMDSNPVKAMRFYADMIKADQYWLRVFNLPKRNRRRLNLNADDDNIARQGESADLNSNVDNKVFNFNTQ